MSGSYILYIDDERSTIKLVKEVLKLAGYTLQGATSGQEGLILMREHKPALLLLDLSIPDMDGITLYREMQKDEMLADVPVIVVSGTIPKDGRKLADDLPPVNDYITKPYKIDRLTRSVTRILQAVVTS